jgi:hypothetical protein
LRWDSALKRRVRCSTCWSVTRWRTLLSATCCCASKFRCRHWKMNLGKHQKESTEKNLLRSSGYNCQRSATVRTTFISTHKTISASPQLTFS